MGTPDQFVSRSAADDRRADALITALAALPTGHPSRCSLRDQAIQAWAPMATRLARRYAGRGESQDDLTQTAMIGLIKAVDRFDPGHSVDFVAYAIPTILGEIKRYFRDHAWSIRVPRRLQEMRMAINDANSVLIHSLGHLPTVAEVAAHLKVTEEEVLEGLEGARAYSATSLSGLANAEGRHEVGDALGSDELGYELTEARLALGPALRRLNDRDRRILTLRFCGDQTQTEIAGQIGVSQMHISRIIARALATLREDLGPDAR
nr:SigB/SigF/SigG family RNA polymerase sigma factor [Actinoplanes toevensis]